MPIMTLYIFTLYLFWTYKLRFTTAGKHWEKCDYRIIEERGILNHDIFYLKLNSISNIGSKRKKNIYDGQLSEKELFFYFIRRLKYNRTRSLVDKIDPRDFFKKKLMLFKNYSKSMLFNSDSKIKNVITNLTI